MSWAFGDVAGYAASKSKWACSASASGSRGGARGSGEARTPRCSKIFRTTTGSMRVAITCILLEHLGQRSTSNPHVRFIIRAQSTYLARAKSAPSSSCPQREMVILVGSTKTTGVAEPGAALGGGGGATVARAAAAELGFIVAGNAGAGTAKGGAGTGTRTGGVPNSGDGVAGAAGAAAAVGADPFGVAAQGFGLAASGGGFGVTRGRHDEREANTPW